MPNNYNWMIDEFLEDIDDNLYYRDLLGAEVVDKLVPFIEYEICNYILSCEQKNSVIQTTIDKIIAHDTNVAIINKINWTSPYENQLEMTNSNNCYDSSKLKILYSAALNRLCSAKLVCLNICNYILDNNIYRRCTVSEETAILNGSRQALKALNCDFVDEVISKGLQSEYLIYISKNIGKSFVRRLTITHANNEFFKDYILRLKTKIDIAEDYYCLEHQYKYVKCFDRILPCICIGSDYPYTYKCLREFLEEE